MHQWHPCKRKEFVHKLKRLGFEGPFIGTKHHFIVYKNHRLAIPSNKEYSIPQLKMILREVESILKYKISVEKWNSL